MRKLIAGLARVREWLKPRRETSVDPIRHVVVLMFENHSFDQMLGCFKAVYPNLDGVDPNRPSRNKDSTGHGYEQRRQSNPVVDPDPKHELEHILNSLESNNSGFVAEYEREYPTTTSEQRQRIMDYFGMGDLQVLHELANNFTICDHWYSSVPGPTWTNRFFVHSGTSLGRVRMPGGWDQNPSLYLGYDQDTIFDRLNEKAIYWKVYHGDVPQSLVLSHQQRDNNSVRYEWLDQFFEDASAPEQDFPQYAFLEPNYFHIPFGEPQNDDHPPHSTGPAQALLGRVYNALRANEQLWNSTLLVILYDENGGFYDHVSPPTAARPDGQQDEWTFDRFGVRVPALLVSPWVEQGILSAKFDHTSLLKYLEDKWRLAPLTERVSRAETFAPAIRRSGQPRTNTPVSVAVPRTMMAVTDVAQAGAEELNENQKALIEFSKHLGRKTALKTAPPRALADTAGPSGEAAVAKQRVGDYLAEKKAKAAMP